MKELIERLWRMERGLVVENPLTTLREAIPALRKLDAENERLASEANEKHLALDHALDEVRRLAAELERAKTCWDHETARADALQAERAGWEQMVKGSIALKNRREADNEKLWAVADAAKVCRETARAYEEQVNCPFPVQEYIDDAELEAYRAVNSLDAALANLPARDGERKP